MRRLTFFSRKKEPFYIMGETLAADFAALLFFKNLRKFKFLKLPSSDLKFIPEFYLPERLAKNFNLKKKTPISYDLVIDDATIIRIKNNFEAFKKALIRCGLKSDAKNFETLIAKKKHFFNIDFFKFAKENFSDKFLTILKSIFFAYKIYEEKISLSQGIKILKDFFSPNYHVKEEEMAAFFKEFNYTYSSDKSEFFRLTDSPKFLKSYTYKKFSYKKFKFKNKKPFSFFPRDCFYLSDEVKLSIHREDGYFLINLYQGELVEIFSEFISYDNGEEEDVEFVNIASDDKSFLIGKCEFPYNYYCIFSSVEETLKGRL